ncbi:uncharacterized protein LOC113855608 [Abrus precatorius]|uniref:Uncharacterized protein LOC113855608 n=1 Tax=Abrus precatorius TaxID=3816 RepID=A0A8B8KGU6_ABRPR|nr:uncharacterized protein LOC113855608 [Abrus precatorius]
MVNANTSKDCLVDTTGVQISSPRNPGLKRRDEIRCGERFLSLDSGEPAEYQGLSAFTGHDPPKFEGEFNPEGAQRWLANVEKVFNAMGCREEHKWETFKAIFLGNYFPRDLKKQKAREFLKQKQGNMTVGEYAAKFQDYPSSSQCVSADRLAHSGEQVRIFEANSRSKTVDTRGSGPAKHDRRPLRISKRLYSGSSNSQSKGSSSQEKSSGNGSGSGFFRGPIKCFRCGRLHMVRDCPQLKTSCSNCGKLGHTANSEFVHDELPCNVVVTTPIAVNHVLLDFKEKTLIFEAIMAEILRLMSRGA